MADKTLAKCLVTVHTVRAANGRIMSSALGSTTTPAVKNTRVVAKIRDVNTAGQYAMQSMKKK